MEYLAQNIDWLKKKLDPLTVRSSPGALGSPLSAVACTTFIARDFYILPVHTPASASGVSMAVRGILSKKPPPLPTFPAG